MKITRRKLAAAALAPAALLAQTPPQAPPPIPANPAEELAAARAQNQRNSAALDKFTVAMSTEPAFQFKA
jgi:hypothetical protein